MTTAALHSPFSSEVWDARLRDRVRLAWQLLTHRASTPPPDEEPASFTHPCDARLASEAHRVTLSLH